MAQKISDQSLAALLTAVNARNVTTSFSLMGCTSVRGSGLKPLRGSEYLEVIELRRSQEEIMTVGETGLDDGLVIDILSNMPPIAGERDSLRGLKIVKFRKQRESDDIYRFSTPFSKMIGDFYLRLLVCISMCVDENGISCSKCGGTLDDYNPLSQEYFPVLAYARYCSKCKRIICNGCDPLHEYCYMCMDQTCSQCGPILPCLWLCDGKSHCMKCKPTIHCPTCNKSHCKDCWFPRKCELCDHIGCGDCGEVDMVFCKRCENHFCWNGRTGTCRELEYCYMCDSFKCLECSTFHEYDDDSVCDGCYTRHDLGRQDLDDY